MHLAATVLEVHSMVAIPKHGYLACTYYLGHSFCVPRCNCGSISMSTACEQLYNLLAYSLL